MDNILGIDSQEFDMNGLSADHMQTPDANLTAPVVAEDQNMDSPSTPVRDPFLSAVDNASAKYSKDQEAADYTTRVTYSQEGKERYDQFPNIYNERYMPSLNNEKLALENWDAWDAVATGWGGFKDSFMASFSQSAYVWPRAAKALFNLDADYLKPTEGETEMLAYELEKSQKENPIFYERGTEDDFLTKGFLAETIQNLGYTFGTLAELGTEWAATSLVSGALASRGGVAPAAGVVAGQAANTTSKLNTFWSNVVRMFNASATDDIAKLSTTKAGTFELGASRYMLQQPARTGKLVVEDLRLMNASTNAGLAGAAAGVNVWDNAMKIASKIPFVGHMADAARLASAARNAELTTGAIMQIGAGGLRRSFAEWQMAAGEAAIEMGANYKEFMDHNAFLDELNGKTTLTGEEYLQRRNMAFQSAGSTFSTNVAILAISNKIMFGNLLGRFGMDSRLLTQLKNAVGSDLARDLGVKTVIRKGVPKHYQLKGFQGLFGTIGVAGQIKRDFGKKVLAWEIGKDVLRGVTNFQVVEGLQENLQEGTNAFYVDYYTDLYRNGVNNWGESFNEAVESQLGKQGAKVFLMGAMTGMFVNPIVNSAQYAHKAFSAQSKEQAESVGRMIDVLNNFYNSSDVSKNVLNEHLKTLKLQTEYGQNMRDAVANGNKYQYFNNKDSALIQAVMYAKRTGTMDYMYQFLKGYGENFSEKEFKEAFGYTPKDLKKSSPKEVMDEIASNVNTFSELYDKYQTKYGLMLSLDEYMKDPSSKMKYSIRKAALMDAIETVAFAEAKGQQATVRSEEIIRRVSQLKSIGNSLASSWNTIVDSKEISDQVLILNNEIKSLQESGILDQNAKDIIASKQREIELLEKIKDEMYESVEEVDPNNPDNKIRYTRPKASRINSEMRSVADNLAEYLALKNKQAGLTSVVNKEEVYSAITDIYDYITLGKDHHEYMQAVNLLSDPDNMTKFYENSMDARAGAHARLLYDQLNMLKELGSEGQKFFENEDTQKLMQDLLEFSKTPYGTYKNYNKLQEIMNNLVEKKNELLLGMFKEAQEEIKKEQAKREEDIAIARSKLPISVYDLYDANKYDEADAYIAMRYNLDELADGFPYDSSDPAQRTINRHYQHPDGSRIAFDTVTIPATYELIAGEGEVPIDNFEKLRQYLDVIEEIKYQEYQAALNKPTERESAELVEELDNEKKKLINHVDQTVVLNGESGTLRMTPEGAFTIEWSDGAVTSLPESNEETTTDDYDGLSLAYPMLAPENAAVVSPNPNPVIEATEEGELAVDYFLDFDEVTGRKQLTAVQINGIYYTLEYNELGELSAFLWQQERRKGKNVKMIPQRLSVRNSDKGQQYAAVVNAFINFAMPEVPTDPQDMQDMSDALDEAIAAIDTVITEESTTKRVRQEIMDQFKLNKIINVNTPDNITELRTKFGNSETRGQMTADELVELALWAGDLRKKIKKQWSIYINNPIVNGFLTQLTKEYINPIDTLLTEKDKDGTKQARDRKATKRNTSKKERDAKSTEAGKPSKRKRGDETVPAESKPKKGAKKKSVADAVDQVQTSFEKKGKKAAAKTTRPSTTGMVNMRIGRETNMINKISSKKLKNIRESIDASIAAPVKDDGINPFNSLNENSTYCE
jgi:hypothetical protein